MKQLKFLMVALTLLMGVSLTSCLNGNDDPTRILDAPLRLVSTYPYTFQYPNDGIKIVATNSTELLTSNIYPGDIVYIRYTYNSDEQPITATTKEIDAKVELPLSNNSNCSLNTRSEVVENSEEGSQYENATIIDLGEASNYGMYYYDRNTLIMIVAYYAKSIENHHFMLLYDKEKNNGEDDVMNLYLRHLNNDSESKLDAAASYKAFDLSEFIQEFGKEPSKIRIYANMTSKNDSWSLDDAKEELQYEEIDYKRYFENNN